MKLMVVTGRSGSGKSVALRVLEDLGYYCVDNLPITLLPDLMETLKDQRDRVAVSLDVRNLPDDHQVLGETLDRVSKMDGLELDILFLDAREDVLIKRYSETRRLHPLSHQSQSLSEAISAESRLLEPLAERTRLRIDTSNANIHELSEQVRHLVLGKKQGELVLIIKSFGFKHGLPQDADYVFDARFLPNPHWIPELKPYTGCDEPVIKYLSSQPEVMKFIWQIENLMQTWLPHLERNNRSYVTVAIGCTGGQHRSVFIAETLGRIFKESNYNVQISHRTLD